MFKINLKQLLLFIMVGFFTTSCDDDPVASVEHNVVGGIELYIDDILVHKQFGGAFYNANGMVGSTAESSIDLNPNGEYEIEVIILNLEGNEIEELEGEDHNDELAFNISNSSIISAEVHEEHHGTCTCDDGTDTTTAETEEECNENICNDATAGSWVEEEGEHHELEFEIETSDVTGTTTFTITLLHYVNGLSHTDYTSDPITVNVEDE
jgi:hypothetical protein|tara:strand:- start:1314 stop:1943 length:630 start_codon:yes stop_codon:yes gene_type:complete